MSRKLLSDVEIGELILVLRKFFAFHKELQVSSDVASYIQRPKIPPFLSEALVVDLGNRGLLLSLECVDYSLSTTGGDVVAFCDSLPVKIEVKATARSAFQLLSKKDIEADYLIWVHFDTFFEDVEKDDIEFFILREPSSVFEKSRKITLPVFMKLSGEQLVVDRISLHHYLQLV